MSTILKLGKFSDKAMLSFVLTGLFLRLISVKVLANYYPNLYKTIEMVGATLIDTGLLLLIFNSLYVNLISRSYIAMAIEMICCLGMIAVELFHFLNATKGNIVFIISGAVFVIVRFYPVKRLNS
jgi:hypothetical protein